jgi:glycosyltransferase involved in cell wall biosynthesis
MFYRHAAGQLDETALTRFHLITFDNTSSEVYSQLLSKPVGVLPLPQFAQVAVTSRVGRRPITVSVLGHQRADKGYHLMPDVARLLLAQEPDFRLLVHNGAPDQMPQTQQELRDCAAVNATRVTLDERTADPLLWEALLRRSDLILCPYEPARFAAAYSAVATEAMANGIPFVVPAKTTMSRLLDTYGNPGTCFDRFDYASIVEATRRALAGFDEIAGRAATAAEQWSATMGAGNMVTALLARCDAA